jgi:hypothetical protein
MICFQCTILLYLYLPIVKKFCQCKVELPIVSLPMLIEYVTKEIINCPSLGVV